MLNISNSSAGLSTLALYPLGILLQTYLPLCID